MHSHSDIMLLVEPRHEAKVFQGVTFELLGQDGLSYAPVTPEILEQIRRHLAGLNGDDPRAGWDWTTVGSYLDRFDRGRGQRRLPRAAQRRPDRRDGLGVPDRRPPPSSIGCAAWSARGWRTAPSASQRP